MYTALSTPAHKTDEVSDDSDSRRISATDRVHYALSEDIRSGLVNPWDRLTEKTISEHFETSRTPVREAVARLVAEGLLQRHADGFGLVLPDVDTIRGLYEARLAIELQGVRRVAKGAAGYDLELLAQLQQRWEQVLSDSPAAEPRMTAWDEEFHRGVLAAAGEPGLVAVLSHINDRIRSLRMYGYIADEQLASSAADHLAVLEALRSGRYVEGEEALAHHITSTRNDSLARALHGQAAAGFIRTA